jgi:SAM-dependent methyltransferase
MNFICPRCQSNLQKTSDQEFQCLVDHLSFRQVDGVWRFLLPQRESHYAQFIKDYETIRSREGRQSKDPSFYRSLPYKDTSGRFSADWRIRAVSFQFLERMLPARSTVIDLGAGNGWLSNRLASAGHEAYAVDLLLNEEDGLGAWKFYQNKFIPVQAEFSKLPFADGFASQLIFNASFHYSENYEETLLEALRVIQSNGMIIVMDSPVYHSAQSGEKMVQERKSKFLAQYGFASDSLHSKNYITHDQMKALGEKLGIHWRHIQPFYGIHWLLRPWWARLRSHREPAEFGLWVGRRA